jgi:hypothetical protein
LPIASDPLSGFPAQQGPVIAPGTRLGTYEIGALIGSGGMGEV